MKKLILFELALVLLILFAVLAYLGYGQEEPKVEWVARYNGPGSDWKVGKAIAVDPSGNVYVTGGSRGSGTYDDYNTVKYDRNGNELWVANYDGPNNDSDYAVAIAVDPSGNVYVTGSSRGKWDTKTDYATVKYDRNGNELWVARYDGLRNFHDFARAITVDSLGNVYVTGDSYGNETYIDYATVKYDRNGNELWVARYNGPENHYDYAVAIAVDPSGNVYVTGYSHNYGTFTDYATVKYDRNGNELWVARYNGPENDIDSASAIAIDPLGNVYVTGYSYEYGTDYDYATVKYDRNGNELWVARYNGPENYYDYAIAITVDFSGNVYVTGDSYGYGTSFDYATVKYDKNGNEVWAARYNGPENDFDSAKAIVVDHSGNVYVTGYSPGIGTDVDYATVKYDRNGNELWIARYNGPGNDRDVAHAITVDPSGNVYVTGASYGSEARFDYTTIKYSEKH